MDSSKQSHHDISIHVLNFAILSQNIRPAEYIIHSIFLSLCNYSKCAVGIRLKCILGAFLRCGQVMFLHLFTKGVSGRPLGRPPGRHPLRADTHPQRRPLQQTACSLLECILVNTYIQLHKAQSHTPHVSFVVALKDIDSLHQSSRAVLNIVIKEQSPCPSVLLAQTKPEGLPEGFEPTKHKGKGIVPIITHGRFCWVQQAACC